MHKNQLNDRTGEVRTMKNGLNATIIHYKTTNDIIIEFENGETRKTRYKDFERGYVKCPMIVIHFDAYSKVLNPNTKHKTEFLIDNDDLDKVMSLAYWSATSHGYIHCRTKDGKILYLHRFIINAPDGAIVDHKNSNKTDCRKENLRLCTQSENTRNRTKRKIGTSKYKGVYWNKDQNKWEVKIAILFDSEEKAALVYNELATKYFGEFAKLNDIL